MSRLKEFMLDKTVTHKRKASDTGNSVEAWATTTANLRMAIYPASSFSTANFRSPLTNVQLSHVGYCYISDATFKIGDRVEEGSNKYSVLGIRLWDADDLCEINMGII